MQALESCENGKIISVIQCLDVQFTHLLIENIAKNILDTVFDEGFFALNQEMIQTIVRYKNSSMVGDLTTRPYSTLINIKYLPLLQCVQDNIELYVNEIVLTNEALKDSTEDIIDLLKRLDGMTELQVQIVRQEQFTLSNIEDCAGDLAQKNKEQWNAVWDELLMENIIEPNWNNIIEYWKIYSLTDTLKEYISAKVDVLKKTDTTLVSDEFIKEFINSEFDEEVQRKLIPVLKMDDFDMDISTIEPSTLQIMIDCRYFAFSAERYTDLTAISPALGVAFIAQNQADFMATKSSIIMSDAIRGKFYSGVPLERVDEILKGTSLKFRPIINFYDYSGDFGNIRQEGGIAFNSGKKPIKMLQHLLFIANLKQNDIVMDFFSGSASTAHAVMNYSLENNLKLKFIMVQYPEKLNEKDDLYREGFHTICDIGKERIRRSASIIQKNKLSQNLDTGFRVLKLDDTNMKEVYYAPDDYSQGILAGLESNIREDRTDLDLLFGCLLDWGLPLSMPYSSEQIDGCTVHTYNDGDLIACFDENVPESVVKEIAKRQPLRAVFRDSSFVNSPAKINVTEIFKLIAPDTRVKVI